ncbi:dihydrolipoamide dehydrogenase [Cephaloticoccus primus]|uniref:Dihydrolipoyl dehydrogenase n=1 Tax=Cephaloticoccus primus TaxID=1548207 RepID=A0A139SJF9_9BACT|nr:dihydrolipoyl dehydrogenase [Cephaloticoccus primus]KXU34705.1 dihydrolipoamide dehydrogenase [Cephaloticoccus primus]
METYDLIVIGAGPGGYVCAFRAAQLGLGKIALIDKRATLGGTCLNVGCIPSKALLASSEHVVFAKKHAAEHGLKIAGLEVDLPAMLKKKESIVAKMTSGLAALAKARKVTVISGEARFLDAKTLAIGDKKLGAANIVVATGSAPVELPFLKFDGERIVSSTEALSFSAVPQKLAVVGGGAIGLELGLVWARLGAEVTVVEFLPQIGGPVADADIVRQYTRLLQAQGLKIEVGAKVTGWEKGTLHAERDGKPLRFAADKVLVSVGRRPFTDSLGLDKAGVALTPSGRIQVDAQLRSSVPHIRAIGDVVDGPMLAHKAEEDGAAVAEWIAGKGGHINWDLMPAIIYTDPELATVGLGEDAAKKAGRKVKVGKFNFAANARAHANDGAEGFVKIIADAETDQLLGAQILGKNAGELISEVVTHMEYHGSAEDLARTIHAHPTMSEAVKEAALAVGKSALHAL